MSGGRLGGGSATYTPLLTGLSVPGSGNVKASTTRNMRKGLARVRSGAGDMKILCTGDSTKWGQGSGGMESKSAPAILAGLLPTKLGVPAAQGLMIPPSVGGTGSDSDSRWTSVGAGWSVTQWGFAKASSYFAQNAGPSGNLVATPGILADTYDVYYLKNPGGTGTLTITASGGTPVVVDTGAAGSPGWGKATALAASASTANTVTIVQSVATSFVYGIEPSHSTIRRVRVANAGVSGSATANWVSNVAAYDSLGCFGAYGPDLVIMNPAVNDAGAAVSSATWTANMTTLITAAKAAGADVIIESAVPSDTGTGRTALESAYRDAIPALCTATGAMWLDVWGRFESWTIANTTGMMVDALHCNGLGYGDIGAAEATFIQQIA